MVRITVTADGPTDEADRLTLSERIGAAQLDDRHYVTQLIERLSWATDDAELIETRAPGGADDPGAEPPRATTRSTSRREARTRRAPSRKPLRTQTTNPS